MSAALTLVEPVAASADDKDLLDCVGPFEDEHVLVIGDALEVMCGLIRRGCAAAAEVSLHERAVTEPADIAVVPRLDTPELAARAVTLARRALAPFGRIILRDRCETLARQAAAMLRREDFSAIRVRVTAQATLVTAECPWFGPIMRAASPRLAVAG